MKRFEGSDDDDDDNDASSSSSSNNNNNDDSNVTRQCNSKTMTVAIQTGQASPPVIPL